MIAAVACGTTEATRNKLKQQFLQWIRPATCLVEIAPHLSNSVRIIDEGHEVAEDLITGHSRGRILALLLPKAVRVRDCVPENHPGNQGQSQFGQEQYMYM